MPYLPSYSATQQFSSPSVVTLTDQSTGSDIAITERRVFVQDYAGTYLKEVAQSANYKVWSIAAATVTLDVLQKDTAVRITVQYVDTNGNVLYTAIKYKCCDINSQTGKYAVLQKWVSDPSIINDPNYRSGIVALETYLVGAQGAITAGSNLVLSQQCLDGAKTMLDKQTLYF